MTSRGYADGHALKPHASNDLDYLIGYNDGLLARLKQAL